MNGSCAVCWGEMLAPMQHRTTALGSACMNASFLNLLKIGGLKTHHEVQDASEEEVERMSGSCAVCWGDMLAPSQHHCFAFHVSMHSPT